LSLRAFTTGNTCLPSREPDPLSLRKVGNSGVRPCRVSKSIHSVDSEATDARSQTVSENAAPFLSLPANGSNNGVKHRPGHSPTGPMQRWVLTLAPVRRILGY